LRRKCAKDLRCIRKQKRCAAQLADERIFRQDLLFRLNTVEIVLPPLRERREDIATLLDHFLTLYARKYDRPRLPVPADVMTILERHDWPGNVRALRHAAERATILAQGSAFAIEDFALDRETLARIPAAAEATPAAPIAAPAAPEESDLNLDRAERQMIERALRLHAYNISHAASALGLTRAALYRRMEKHGL